MNRREFITLLGGAAAAWPLAARAQQPASPLVGVLSPLSARTRCGAQHRQALRAGLRDLGYVEGRNVTLELRCAGRPVRLACPTLAAELVRSIPT